MKIEEIYQRLTPMFQDIFGDDTIVLTPEMNSSSIEGWDSAAMIDLILAAEAHFEIRFTSREVDGLLKVDDLANLIAKKQQDQSSSSR